MIHEHVMWRFCGEGMGRGSLIFKLWALASGPSANAGMAVHYIAMLPQGNRLLQRTEGSCLKYRRHTTPAHESSSVAMSSSERLLLVLLPIVGSNLEHSV